MGNEFNAVEVDMIPNEQDQAAGAKRSTSSSSSFKRKTGADEGFVSRSLCRYATFSYNRPWLTSCSVFAVTLIILVIVVASQMFEITEENGKSWFVLHAKETRRQDAYEEAVDIMAAGYTSPERSVNEWLFMWYFVYKASNGNMLTPANLAVVMDTEKVLTNATGVYATENCLLTYTGNQSKCTPPLSWTSVFEGTQIPTETQIESFKADYDLNGGDLGKFLLDENYAATKTSKFTRSHYYFGAPLKGYTSATKDLMDQHVEMGKDQLDLEESLVDKFGLKASWALDSKYKDKAVVKTDDGEVEVVWASTALMDQEVSNMVSNDFLWAFFCIIAVWIYMTIHLQSMILATVGMYEIVLAFPIAFFFYKGIFQVSFFQELHVLAIFVMLGLGADDVFVFVDAFKQAKMADDTSDLKDWVQYASNRASKAIFATSLTTAGAFAATTTSNVMPIAAFGIFASLLVFMLFLINVVLLPPVLVLYERNWGDLPCCVYTNSCLHSSCCKCCVDKDSDNLKQSGRAVENFFNGPFSSIFIYSNARYVVVAVFAVVFVLGAIFAAELKPPEEQSSWFPEQHLYTKALNWQEDQFADASTDEVTTVTVVWGLKGMSRNGVNWWDPEDRGKMRYDDTFDPTKVEAQSHILKICKELRLAKCDEELCMPYGTLVRNGEVKCVLEAFDEYLNATHNQQLPISDKQDFLTKLLTFSNMTETKSNYADMVGFFMDNDCTAPTCVKHPNQDATLNLKFIAIVANATFSNPQAHTLITPCNNAWEGFQDKWNEDPNSPESANKMFQTSYAWVWALTMKSLVDIVVNGMGITFTLAFVVLVFATGNLILSLISIITIAGIVLTVLGIGCRLIMGWSLDVTESIASVILIGFSVDYCVHLAHAYMECVATTRQMRMQDSVTTMGISVSAGALTTFMAGIFLFGAVMPFFQKFGFIIVFTVISSFFWAVIFFTSACAIVGPEGDTGDVFVLYKRAKASLLGSAANSAS